MKFLEKYKLPLFIIYYFDLYQFIGVVYYTLQYSYKRPGNCALGGEKFLFIYNCNYLFYFSVCSYAALAKYKFK